MPAADSPYTLAELCITAASEAWRGDGAMVTQEALGDPNAFNGNGYMLLGLQVTAYAPQYRDDSAARGGPMMLAISPTLPSDHGWRAAHSIVSKPSLPSCSYGRNSPSDR